MRQLETGQVVKSSLDKNSYKIIDLLGEGGFGRAYRATATIAGHRLANHVCLKTTADLRSWHRESYFGELLDRNKRVIEMYESFVLPPKQLEAKSILYCLVQELAEHGDLLSYLEKNPKPWSEKRAKREILALLRTLDQLHGGNATHRDITPMNIFVCKNGILKLGDFGIARHELAGATKTIDAFNPWFVPPRFLRKLHPHWDASDDVYQMGQVLAMLVSGKVSEPGNLRSINRLKCTDEIKFVLKRAIGPRKSRFSDAYEMLQSLNGNHDQEKPKLRTIKGKKVIFTGKLSIKRFDAEILTLQAGGTVGKDMNRTVDVIVQGKRSPSYKKGHKGRKLLSAEKMIKQGRKVHVIGEAEFRRLVRK